MTHPLSSSTESEALRIGDPAPPVIPHLMRDPFGLDSRFHGNDGRGAGIQKLFVWIPIFTGMTEGGRE